MADLTNNNTHSEPIIVPTPCPQCNAQAQIQVLTVTIPNEAPTVISSFNCSSCHLRESTTFDGDIGDGTGILITCNFDSAEDLKRYIRLPRLSSVKFIKGDDGFEFTTGSTGIFLVEAIIRKTIDDLGGIFNIQTSTVSSMGLRESIPNEVDDHDAAEVQIRVLQGLLKDPRFKMEITDKTGLARVAPRGKLLSEIREEEEFDDGYVFSSFFEVNDNNEALNH